MVVLEASSGGPARRQPDAAVPQAVLDRPNCASGLLGDVTVLDALEIPRPRVASSSSSAFRPPGSGAARGCQAETTRADTPPTFPAGLHLMVVDDHRAEPLGALQAAGWGASLECFESAGAALERLRNGGGSADVVLMMSRCPKWTATSLPHHCGSYPRCWSSDSPHNTLAEDRHAARRNARTRRCRSDIDGLP